MSAAPVLDAGLAETTGVPGWLVSALLLVCLFAPYGTFGVGGGTLRVDHVVVYAVGLGVLAFVRPMRALPELAIPHAALFVLACLATVRHRELAESNALATLKSADNLIRAPWILWVAASMRRRSEDLKALMSVLLAVSVVFFTMALVDRLAPTSEVGEWLASTYGGPPYVAIGLNHKQMMNLAGRASASFITAPSLGMASVLLLLVSLFGRDLLGRGRWLMMFSAAGAGLLSNSKSFILGVPLLLMLMPGRHVYRWGAIVLVGAAWAAVVVAAPQSLPVSVNPLSDLGEASDPLWLLTSGRFSEEGSILWVSEHVLEHAPLTGYGFAVNEAVTYADSALNRYMLYGGCPGLALGAVGFVWQTIALLGDRSASPLRAIGWRAMVIGCAFWLVGPFLQMARISDLFAVIVGAVVAHQRPARTTPDSSRRRRDRRRVMS
jgi:hypothetical protein